PSSAVQRQRSKGVWLSDGHVHARRVKRLKKSGESTWLRIVLAEGKNREIRRLLARLGHKVLRLKRIAIGPIRIGDLKSGKARRLKADEVELLRQAAHRQKRSSETQATSASPSIFGRTFWSTFACLAT